MHVYDKKGDFSFPIVNFPFWLGMFLWPLFYDYISQLVRFAHICNNVSDFNDRNLVITGKPLHQGRCFHKLLLKTFTIFFYCYKDLVYMNTILHAEI